MKNALDLHIKGIRCDNCDWSDPTAEFSDTWLNVPCPECSANLLTEADYATVKFMLALTTALNKVIDPVPDSDPRTTLKLKMDGSGIPMIDEDD